jgi:hypothetical protein
LVLRRNSFLIIQYEVFALSYGGATQFGNYERWSR